MKLIIKKFMTKETLVELNIEDPTKLTLGEFSDLFFKQLTQKMAYYIEPTQYTVRTNIISEDFNFFHNGKRFTAANDIVYGFNNRNEKLSKYISSEQEECIIHANLAVYGKRNYCLNSKINMFSRIDALDNQITELQTSLLKGFVS